MRKIQDPEIWYLTNNVIKTGIFAEQDFKQNNTEQEELCSNVPI